MAECPSKAADRFNRSQEPGCSNCGRLHRKGSKAEKRCLKEMCEADRQMAKDYEDDRMIRGRGASSVTFYEKPCGPWP